MLLELSSHDASYSFGRHHCCPAPVARPPLSLPPSGLVLPPNFDYHPKHNFVFDRTLFAQALAIASHLSLGMFSRMVYEHLLGCFILEDPSSRFSELFKLFLLLFMGISLGRWP